jgi:hypothetical protein
MYPLLHALKMRFPKEKIFCRKSSLEKIVQCRKCCTAAALMAYAFCHAPFGIADFQIFFREVLEYDRI